MNQDTVTVPRELLQRMISAIDMLIPTLPGLNDKGRTWLRDEIIESTDALRAALDAPAVEPEAWYDGRKFYATPSAAHMDCADIKALRPLYEAPQAQQPAPVQEPASASPTAGMNIAQRILHVGGRNNAAGYIEFGSIQAVEALVRQVLRDLPPADIPLLSDDEIYEMYSEPRSDAEMLEFGREVEAAVRKLLIATPQPAPVQEPARRRIAIEECLFMNGTVTKLMGLVDKAITAQDQRLGHLAQCYRQALQDELVKLFTPLTDEQIKRQTEVFVWLDDPDDFRSGVKWAEEHHGITGESNEPT